jgi:hypothetical protein
MQLQFQKGIDIAEEEVDVPCQLITTYNTEGEINCKTEIPTILSCPAPNWIWWQTYQWKDIRGSSIYPIR